MHTLRWVNITAAESDILITYTRDISFPPDSPEGAFIAQKAARICSPAAVLR